MSSNNKNTIATYKKLKLSALDSFIDLYHSYARLIMESIPEENLPPKKRMKIRNFCYSHNNKTVIVLCRNCKKYEEVREELIQKPNSKEFYFCPECLVLGYKLRIRSVFELKISTSLKKHDFEVFSFKKRDIVNELPLVKRHSRMYQSVYKDYTNSVEESIKRPGVEIHRASHYFLKVIKN